MLSWSSGQDLLEFVLSWSSCYCRLPGDSKCRLVDGEMFCDAFWEQRNTSFLVSLSFLMRSKLLGLYNSSVFVNCLKARRYL